MSASKKCWRVRINKSHYFHYFHFQGCCFMFAAKLWSMWTPTELTDKPTRRTTSTSGWDCSASQVRGSHSQQSSSLSSPSSVSPLMYPWLLGWHFKGKSDKKRDVDSISSSWPFCMLAGNKSFLHKPCPCLSQALFRLTGQPFNKTLSPPVRL